MICIREEHVENGESSAESEDYRARKVDTGTLRCCACHKNNDCNEYEYRSSILMRRHRRPDFKLNHEP